MPVPRLRVFAGPNGSGKSTIKEQIPANLIGTYVNADEIEKEANASGFVDLAKFDITTTLEALQTFFADHPLLQKAGQQDHADLITLNDQRVDFRGVQMNSYYASVMSDFIRHNLLAQKVSFTFETVMSFKDKVEFMQLARANGYRTYLYFVATESPEININRVANRVDDGGHDVAQDKIIERYYRSVELLPAAIAASNRAYIFDNSGEQSVLLAEVTDGTELQFHEEEIPDWFVHGYVDKVTNSGDY
ncbi:zeta toxin family protein [Pseudomonas sp. SMV71]|uniref:zeta toxin family protein n=1 Tax=unclassified Pseudomonas TaxID=196821 RepID=UPI003F84813F